ncbi:hypothetical protein FHS15_001910 [Paenibacillus castaneae]|uniref:hypothetical protein n=1 Tax=Paenibacillus castaneae TaxID=474957 RepID=UPI00141AAA02|nr:hypothetical protein [Paenibacillus castaneae]NIK76785.1 hypothetical protein [Paenibacillus castaneae]
MEIFILFTVFFIIIILGIAMIEVKLKKKLENDERMIERLNVIIEELKSLKKET